MSEHDLISIFSLADPIKAEMIKNMLQVEGIPCTLGGEATAANLGLAAFEIEVLVPAIHADRASKLIESHEKGRGAESVVDHSRPKGPGSKARS